MLCVGQLGALERREQHAPPPVAAEQADVEERRKHLEHADDRHPRGGLRFLCSVLECVEHIGVELVGDGGAHGVGRELGAHLGMREQIIVARRRIQRGIGEQGVHGGARRVGCARRTLGNGCVHGLGGLLHEAERAARDIERAEAR